MQLTLTYGPAQLCMTSVLSMQMLGWRHNYHALLEELGALQEGSRPAATAVDGPSRAQSVPQQRRLQRIAMLESQLRDIETRRLISQRWSADSEEYGAAGRERKVLEIQRCETNLQSLFVRHHALQRELRSTPFRERQRSVGVRKSMGTVQAKAKQVIQDLQAWHAAPGPNQLHYDPHTLDASTLLAADLLPWQQQSATASLLTMKRAELKELDEKRQRCLEEYQILQREACDMVLFYEHYESQLDAQVSILQSADVYISSMPGELHADTAGAAYRSGATAILLGKLKHIRAMHEAANVLVAKLEQRCLEMPSSNGNDDATFTDAVGDLVGHDHAADDGAIEGLIDDEEALYDADEGMGVADSDVFFDASGMDIDGFLEEGYESMSS